MGELETHKATITDKYDAMKEKENLAIKQKVDELTHLKKLKAEKEEFNELIKKKL